MSWLFFIGTARVNDLGDQGKAENDKQGGDNRKHGFGPFVGSESVGYCAKGARI